MLTDLVVEEIIQWHPVVLWVISVISKVIFDQVKVILVNHRGDFYSHLHVLEHMYPSLHNF